MKVPGRGIARLASVLLGAGAAYAAETTATQAAGEQCEALSGASGAALGEPTARIVSAVLQPARQATVDPAAPPWLANIPAMPSHCEVLGVMRERTGAHGQQYAVRFRLRLPSQWNGRFLFQGGGGTNGVLADASGGGQPGMRTPLEQGYAVVTTDTGHDNARNFDAQRQGAVAFGHDYEARLEYSEKALDSVATAAKRIIGRHYGRPPARSYFAGCSNGGREGMEFAQRFPGQFDGIVAAAPAFAVPKAAIAEAWDTQAFAALARAQGLPERNGLPDLARTFSQVDLDMVAAAINSVCDADDGLQDGMVQDITKCTTARVKAALEARTCAGNKLEGCLAREQVTALLRSLAGPRNGGGQALYSDWPWDPGIAGTGWRVWKIGIPGGMDAINVTLGSPALSGLFMTPPSDVPASFDASMRFQLGFDFDRDAPRIFGTDAEFPRSGWDLVGAQSTDLRRFRERGGRMIVPHGHADPIFSINDSIAWWNKVNRASAGRASEFVRVYPVPGMNHCNGGPATDQYDALAAVVDWVEKGKPPDRIEARAGAQTPWPGRSRPLCPYPSVARYAGGNPEDAASFACRR